MFSRQRPLNLFHVTLKLLKVRPILTKLAPISLQPFLYFENNEIPIQGLWCMNLQRCVGCKTWSNRMRKGGFGRIRPPKGAPLALFFNTEGSFSKSVHLLVKKFWVLGSAGTSKVIINIQTGILWFAECFHKHRLSPQQLCDVGRRESLRVQRGQLLVQGHTGSQPRTHVRVLREAAGSAVASEQTAGVWWPGSRPWGSEPYCPLLYVRKEPSSKPSWVPI